MIINFQTSGRSVEIDNEINFDRLKSYELSELLYIDCGYIRWMNSIHIKKFTDEDLVDILTKNPDLIEFLSISLKKVSTDNWVLILENNPELLEKVKYINHEAYLIYKNAKSFSIMLKRL